MCIILLWNSETAGLHFLRPVERASLFLVTAGILLSSLYLDNVLCAYVIVTTISHYSTPRAISSTFTAFASAGVRAVLHTVFVHFISRNWTLPSANLEVAI